MIVFSFLGAFAVVHADTHAEVRRILGSMTFLPGTVVPGRS